MSNKFDVRNTTEVSDGSDEEESGPIITDLGTLEYPTGEHRIQHPYCMWYSRRPSNYGTLRYGEALRLIGQMCTVEQWWSVYAHINRIADFRPFRDLHLFKKGIKPMWEDVANKKGGKWVIRMKREYAGRAWENLCMAMLGEQFMVAGNEICGVVVSIRYQDALLSIWNRTASDQMIINRIRDAIKRLLNMPPSINMEYKTHTDCLKNSKSLPHVGLIHT